jgi:hypothetical protein
MEIVVQAELCEVAADLRHAVINKTWLFHKQYIPSGHQTWQWKIHHFHLIFPAINVHG